MRDLVRVKDPDTGHEFTTTSARAEKAGLRVLVDAIRVVGARRSLGVGLLASRTPTPVAERHSVARRVDLRDVQEAIEERSGGDVPAEARSNLLAVALKGIHRDRELDP